MRTSPSKSPLSRRLAAAVILPGLLTTSMVLVQPAVAATGTVTGICNGVVNQLAHRGNVQENLLKAAAKKNADIILALQAEKATLQSKADALTADIAAADKTLAAMDAQATQLDKDAAAAQAEVDQLGPLVTAKSGAVAQATGDLAALRSQQADVQNALIPLQEQLTAAQTAADGLKAQAADLAAKQADNAQALAAAQA